MYGFPGPLLSKDGVFSDHVSAYSVVHRRVRQGPKDDGITCTDRSLRRGYGLDCGRFFSVVLAIRRYIGL